MITKVLCYLTMSLLPVMSGCFNNRQSAGQEYTVATAGISAIRGELIVVDTLVIPVDSLTSNRDPYLQIIETGGEPYLVLFNANTYRVQGYHFYDSTKNWYIKLTAEGPNGIAQPERFYVHNMDSVFFISGDNVQLVFLADSTGRVKKRYDLSPAFLNHGKWITNSHFFEFRYLPELNSVSFWIYPDDYMSYEGYAYYRGAKACIYNLETSGYHLFGGFPRQYFADNNLYEVFNYIHGYATPRYWVLHYNGSPEVQVYNRGEWDLWKIIDIPSQYLDKIPPLMRVGESRKTPQQEINYQAGTGYYFGMQTNAQGTRHYRMVFHQAGLRYPSGKKRHYEDIPFSVMVLDEHFALITERAFTGGVYDVYQSFAYGENYYLSINNPLNKSYNEDVFQFAVFALE